MLPDDGTNALGAVKVETYQEEKRHDDYWMKPQLCEEPPEVSIPILLCGGLIWAIISRDNGPNQL